MSISSSAVLVRLNISVWTARKLDRNATDNVIATNGAAEDAAQVHKNLMAGTHLRKDIADYAAECRLWHNTWTLGWEDRGSRLLPTSLFLDYKAQANLRRDKFNAMVWSKSVAARFRDDYTERKEVTGADGGPIKTESKIDISGLDLDELEALEKALTKTGLA